MCVIKMLMVNAKMTRNKDLSCNATLAPSRARRRRTRNAVEVTTFTIAFEVREIVAYPETSRRQLAGGERRPSKHLVRVLRGQGITGEDTNRVISRLEGPLQTLSKRTARSLSATHHAVDLTAARHCRSFAAVNGGRPRQAARVTRAHDGGARRAAWRDGRTRSGRRGPVSEARAPFGAWRPRAF